MAALITCCQCKYWKKEKIEDGSKCGPKGNYCECVKKNVIKMVVVRYSDDLNFYKNFGCIFGEKRNENKI